MVKLNTANLGEYCQIDSRYAFKSAQFTNNEDDICLVKGSNIGHRKINWEDAPKWSSNEFDQLARYQLILDDVVVAMDRPIVGGNLKFAWIQYSDPQALLVQRVARLRGKNGLDQKYLKSVIADPAFKAYIDTITTGVNVPHISGPDMRRYKFPLPTLPTQQKTAQILSAYDDLIENNLKRIKLLEEMAQITYEQWFVRMKFPNNETTTIDAETGLPEGWEIAKVGSLLGKLKVTRKIKSSEYSDKGTIPIVDQSKNFIAGYTNDEETKIESHEPIIVFGDHTRILKLIDFPFARGADGTQIIKSKDKRIPQYQFYFALKTIDLSDYHYARHFKFLKESFVIVPTNDIAIEFEKESKDQFDNIKLLRDTNMLLKEAREILLPRLMTGMIDVDKIKIPCFKTKANV